MNYILFFIIGSVIPVVLFSVYRLIILGKKREERRKKK